MLAGMASVMAQDAGDAAADWGAFVGLLLAVIALLTWLLRPVFKFFRFLGEFRDDWKGEPERPGVPGRPGVMSTLSDIRSDANALAARVHKLERDLLKVRSEVTWLLSRCRGEHDHEGNSDA